LKMRIRFTGLVLLFGFLVSPAASPAQARKALPDVTQQGDGSAADAFLRAASRGDLETVKKLLTGNPDLIFSRDMYGSTALKRAADAINTHGGHKDVVKFLLDKGADVNAHANVEKLTPLHVAAAAGNKAIVELLLVHGADVNAKDGRGKTPLFYAAFSDEHEVIAPGVEHPEWAEVASLLRQHGGRE
jgi:ankyrin repeat protein